MHSKSEGNDGQGVDPQVPVCEFGGAITFPDAYTIQKLFHRFGTGSADDEPTIPRYCIIHFITINQYTKNITYQTIIPPYTFLTISGHG